MSTLPNLLAVFFLVAVLLGLGVAAMAVGVIFKRPCLRGSCGGPALHTAGGEKISCATCPNRHKHAAHGDDDHRPDENDPAAAGTAPTQAHPVHLQSQGERR